MQDTTGDRYNKQSQELGLQKKILVDFARTGSQLTLVKVEQQKAYAIFRPNLLPMLNSHSFWQSRLIQAVKQSSWHTVQSLMHLGHRTT